MLEDALEFANLAEKFSKQDTTKQPSKPPQLRDRIVHDVNYLIIIAAVKKDKKNSVLDSRKSYNICKHHCCSLIEQSIQRNS